MPRIQNYPPSYPRVSRARTRRGLEKRSSGDSRAVRIRRAPRVSPPPWQVRLLGGGIQQPEYRVSSTQNTHRRAPPLDHPYHRGRTCHSLHRRGTYAPSLRGGRGGGMRSFAEGSRSWGSGWHPPLAWIPRIISGRASILLERRAVGAAGRRRRRRRCRRRQRRRGSLESPPGIPHFAPDRIN